LEVSSENKTDFSISLAKANALAIPIAIICGVVSLVPFITFWGINKMVLDLTGFNSIITLFIAIIVGIFLHEILHGIGWKLFAGVSIKSVKFGINFTTFTPYAHCPEPMESCSYKLAAVLPGLILGFIPSFLNLVIGSGFIALFSAFFSIAACGDLLIIWIIRKTLPHQLVEDHPSRAGCFVYK